MNHIRLNNGIMMPQVGFGVYKVSNEEITDAIMTAFDAGYRAIDTAQYYQNEAGLGEAIVKSGIPREELFITSKVWNSHHGYERTIQAFEESLEKMKLDYLDLYLVHWPVPEQDKYIETYQALEKLYADGRVKSIGVSNFHTHHLERLLKECNIIPVINQVECHPYLQQKDLKDFCKKHDISVECWAPLYRGGGVFQEKIITDLANKYQKTVAQITLRWHIQEGSVLIPKSVTPSRIKENLDLFDFELSHKDMEAIGSLDKNSRLGRDPDLMNVTDL